MNSKTDKRTIDFLNNNEFELWHLNKLMDHFENSLKKCSEEYEDYIRTCINILSTKRDKLINYSINTFENHLKDCSKEDLENTKYCLKVLETERDKYRSTKE